MRNLLEFKLQFNFTFMESENMYPWERDVYMDMLKAKLKEENG